MGIYTAKPEYTMIKEKGKEKRVFILRNANYSKFNSDILELGDISLPSEQVEAIAAVFDLTGFTMFCSQVDPHLAVPEFLSSFIEWIFDEIKNKSIEKSYRKGKKLWAPLPFMVKFLGDGVLFLWDTKIMNDVAIRNVVLVLDEICDTYEEEFIPIIRKIVSNPPESLRCGIARGKVCSIGNGQDYIGPCINIASRLHQISCLKFCFSRRGFDMGKSLAEAVRESYIEKCITIRGIGENELVWVRKDEFNSIPDEEKELFKEP